MINRAPFVLGMMLAMLVQVKAQAAAPPVVLAESKPFVSTSTQVQHFEDNIEMKQGQQHLQLTLTYYNGSAKAPGYKWLRIASPSMNYVSEQQFMGQKTLSIDVSGELTWGGNQILITAGGEPGATLSWVLSTPQPTITGADTTAISQGGTLTITGTNFCPNPVRNTVMINGESAQVISATANTLHVTVPEGAPSGPNKATVTVAGINAGTVPFTVCALPYLTRLSAGWVAPGNPMTIYGGDFGNDPSQVVVYVGPVRAGVNSCSDNQINITMPWASPNGGTMATAWAGYYMPVKVAINGVKARNTLNISSSLMTGP